MESSRYIKSKTTGVLQYPLAVAFLSPLKVLFLAIFKIKFCVAHRILPTQWIMGQADFAEQIRTYFYSTYFTYVISIFCQQKLLEKADQGYYLAMALVNFMNGKYGKNIKLSTQRHDIN